VQNGNMLTSYAQPERTWLAGRGAYIAAVICLGVALAVAVFVVPPAAIIAGVIAVAVAVLVLREPFWGLVAVLVLEFLRLQQIVPALAPLHLPRLLTLWVALAWALRTVVLRKAPVVRDRQHAVMAAILAVGALSLLGAYWRGQAFQTLLDLAKQVVVFFLIVNLATDRRRVRILLWSLVLLNAWLGFSQLTGYKLASSSATLIRLGTGTDSFLGNSVDFAVALAVALPFAVFFIFAERSRILRVGALLLAGLFVASLVATGARAGAVGLAVLAVVMWLKSPRKAVGFALVASLLVGWWYLSPPSYHQQVLSIADYEQDPSALGRIEAWRAAREMLTNRPLTGVGIGNFSTARALAYSPPGQQNWLTVHNIVLQAGAEMGLLGLFVYSLLVFFVFGDNRRTRRAAEQVGGDAGRWYRNIANAMDASLIGFLATSFFVTTLYYPHLYLIAGIAVALKHAVLADAGYAEQAVPQAAFAGATPRLARDMT